MITCRWMVPLALAAALAAGGCDSGGLGDQQGGGGSGSPPGGGSQTPPQSGGVNYGEVHSGMYHLGPVTFDENPDLGHLHDACAPGGGYVSGLQTATGLGGEWLAGLSQETAGAGATCDACILIQAKNGHSLVARVVTYGDENAAGDIDVSPQAYAALNTNEWPRDMTWQFTRCPDAGTLAYEFKSASSQWWAAVWVRNPRVPIAKVEMQSGSAGWVTLQRETDGSLWARDFGTSFALRVTAIDGQAITQGFTSMPAGQVVTSSQQFQ